MDFAKKAHFFPTKEILTYLVLSLCSIVVLIRFVNVTPHVDQDFFFSSSDPQLQQEKRVSKMFKRRDTQLVLCVQGDIESFKYAKRIKNLCHRIASVPGVINVVSITNGPNDIKDALGSPFWKRLLIAEDKESTNIIVILEADRSRAAVVPIEQMAKQAEAKNFSVLMSGVPYIVKLIHRQLVHDFSIFSLLAIAIFSLVVLYIFN